jgi:hypothetical protein
MPAVGKDSNVVKTVDSALLEKSRSEFESARGEMTLPFSRASEVRFQLKSGQPVANSGPGVRAEPTPSPTAGRKPEAGPPDTWVSTERPSLTLKVGRVGDCKGGGWNHPPLLRACNDASRGARSLLLVTDK